VLVSQRVDFGEAANTQAALLVSLMEQMSYVIARQRIGLPDGRGAVMGPIEASPAYSHPGLILKGVFAGEQGWKFSVPQ
jgi:hypothetical protein